jgi:WD40 repeat protein
LEGHTKAVSCVEFEEKGNLLASYSASDLTLRLWKVGNAGFFSAIMSGTGKSAKDIKLKPLPGADKPLEKHEKSRNFSEVEEQRGDKHRCKIVWTNGDKAVELTREDGTVEFHKLQK